MLVDHCPKDIFIVIILKVLKYQKTKIQVNHYMNVSLVEESFGWKQLKSEKDKQKLRRKKKSSRDGSKKGSFISVWNVLNALNNLNLPCILNILISSKIEIPMKLFQLTENNEMIKYTNWLEWNKLAKLRMCNII